jgi:hypothetical protein
MKTIALLLGVSLGLTALADTQAQDKGALQRFAGAPTGKAALDNVPLRKEPSGPRLGSVGL